MKYITKNFRNFYNAMPDMDCTYDKPGICPHCGIAGNADDMSHQLYSNNGLHFVFLVMRCTVCKKFFTATYRVKNRKSELLCIAPKTISRFHDEYIEQMSPRFIATYNQALRAKDNDDIDLAAIGFRSSLEILVKDYAIVELRKDVKNVSGKTLNNAISEYLPDANFVNTADVVRILGNDYTHYVRHYPELDFKLLEEYMNIFIALIRSRLLIAHPPVSRQS